MIPPNHKECRGRKGCGNVKPLSEFGRREKDKYQAYCKECTRLNNRNYRANNRKYVQTYNKKYRELHPELKEKSRLSEEAKLQNKMVRRKKHYDELLLYAKQKNGQVVSPLEAYKTAHTKLTFRCDQGHDFDMSSNNLLSKKRWCPTCTLPHKRERFCRFLIESMTGKPFRKTRPKWLRNPVGSGNLELDMYNGNLKVALEHNGEQHYRYKTFYSFSVDDFYNLQTRDLHKAKLCHEQKVSLIIVPYSIPEKQLPKFISQELQKFKVPHQTIDDLGINVNNYEAKKRQAEEFATFIKAKGGKKLSGVYLKQMSRVRLECKEGHQWTTTFGKIMRGSWCGICARKHSPESRQKLSAALKNFHAQKRKLEKKNLKKTGNEKRTKLF